MNESLRSMGPSLKIGSHSRDKVAKSPLYTSNFDNGHSNFEDATHNLNDWETLRRHPHSHRLHFGEANDIEEVNMPSTSFDNTGVTAHDPPPLRYTSPPTCRTDQLQLSNDDHAFSVEESWIAPMAPNQLTASRPSSTTPQTPIQHYGPFIGQFSNSEHAKSYRRNKMRFGRLPWRDPESDPTIAETERHRDFHVERIYNAMVCGNFARDNINSTALKRWVYGAHYQSDLVEAYAHKVFDCLLEQVKKGFRGWHQNDYVNDERKGDDDDKDIDCAGRLDNIITALQQEKSICENVMSSAWQIRMFVNAPKAYAKRKDQNRVGNSKRPNMKRSEVEECEPRPAKRPKNATTIRSKPARCGSTTPKPRLPTTTTLQRQHKRPLELANNSPSGLNATSSMLSMGSSPSSHTGPSGQQANDASLSPILSPPVLRAHPQHDFQRGTLMLSTQQRWGLPPHSPYESIPESSILNMTPPATIDPNLSGWPIEAHLDFPLSTSPQSEFTANAISEESQKVIQPFSPCDAVDYSDIFEGPAERGVNLLDAELVPFSGMTEGLQDDFFDTFWPLQQTDVLEAPDTKDQQAFH